MTNLNIYLSFLTVLLVLLCGCGSGKRPNVLIITMDTTRADRLGCYGWGQAYTPNLDQLAVEGTLFEDAQAVMPITLPTHATIFTGYLPLEHGVRINRDYAVPENIPTMAEYFQIEGYQTAAFIAAPVLDGKYGLNRGFDFYGWEHSDGHNAPLNQRRAMRKKADQIADSTIEWLQGRLEKSKKPFFVWSHFFDPHGPLVPHPELRRTSSQDEYDLALTYMDIHIGRIIKFLKEQGELDNTLIMAVADHGESLGDHDELMHGFYIYQSTQHIPLIFRWPGIIPAGARLSGSISQTDLMPTICDLTGIEFGNFRGYKKERFAKPAIAESFANELTGKREMVSRVCHMEEIWTYNSFGWAPLAGIVEGGWSYIRAPESELYDLSIDSGQTNNIAKKELRLLDRMAVMLDDIEKKVAGKVPDKVSVSETEAKRFAALGYLAGKSDTLSSLSQENDLMKLVNPGSRSHVVWANNYRILFKGDTSEEALKALLILIDEMPTRTQYMIEAAEIYIERDQLDAAVKMFNRILSVEEGNINALMQLTGLYGKTENYKKMLECYKKLMQVASEDTKVRNNLNAVLLNAMEKAKKSGDVVNAKKILMDWLKIDPENDVANTALERL